MRCMRYLNKTKCSPFIGQRTATCRRCTDPGAMWAMLRDHLSRYPAVDPNQHPLIYLASTPHSADVEPRLPFESLRAYVTRRAPLEIDHADSSSDPVVLYEFYCHWCGQHVMQHHFDFNDIVRADEPNWQGLYRGDVVTHGDTTGVVVGVNDGSVTIRESTTGTEVEVNGPLVQATSCEHFSAQLSIPVEERCV
jgi:hypothetical protein